MPEEKKIYVGTTPKLIVYIKNNLTDAVTVKYEIWKANGVEIEVNAIIDDVWNAGTGRATTSFQCLSTTLDKAGDYSIQAKVAFASTNFLSITRYFTVYAPYK